MSAYTDGELRKVARWFSEDPDDLDLFAAENALDAVLPEHDRQLRERVQAIPRREWDENDADSMAANTARAYNSGLAAALAALAAPVEQEADQ